MCANRIHGFINQAVETDGDELIFDAIQYNLICIGEAVRNLSDEIRDANVEIPWQLVAGMRNRLAHEYFQISREQVDSVINDHLDPFAEQCKILLLEINSI